MKVNSNGLNKGLNGAVEQLKQAHQAAGGLSSEIRNLATPFYERLTHGGAFSEAKLKLKLALSPSSQTAMTELWRIVFDTPKSETQRNDRLSTWTASNKSLLGWMSKDAQAMIATIVDGRGAAKGIDDGINRAEDALAKAFGTPVVDKGERQALKSFAHEAHSAGFTAAAYGADLDALMKKTVVMFTPGAKAALLSLRSTLADPSSTNVQRRDAFRAFQQQHPNLSASLSFGSMGKDLSVADWSDGRFAAAEQALKDAFSKAA